MKSKTRFQNRTRTETPEGLDGGVIRSHDPMSGGGKGGKYTGVGRVVFERRHRVLVDNSQSGRVRGRIPAEGVSSAQRERTGSPGETVGCSSDVDRVEFLLWPTSATECGH